MSAESNPNAKPAVTAAKTESPEKKRRDWGEVIIGSIIFVLVLAYLILKRDEMSEGRQLFVLLIAGFVLIRATNVISTFSGGRKNKAASSEGEPGTK